MARRRRSRLQRGLRVTLVAMAVNLSLAATKLAAGIWGHSNALIGDAVESFTDLLSSLIVWRGLAVAAVPPDKEHPYGHGKAEPLAVAAVAMMLLFAAVGIALQAGQALFDRHAPPEAFTLWVLLVVIVVKELLYRFALREAEIIDSSAVRTDAWHHRSDAITSLAAAVGIGMALVGGPRWAAADDVAALVAAAVVGFNGARLLRLALHELMDAAPAEEERRQLCQRAEEVEGVERVEKCLVRKAGVQWFVELHIEVDAGMSVARAHAIAHAVEEHLQTRFPTVAEVLVHVEPHAPVVDP